ncbi:hypothetical protein RB2150_11596 [Rhodobacteraceae bacterium HTCC2150]|nr:hypothetical protein RB2150_11596 [Rhodobacteraceae bacterium HTCC2150]
MKSILGSLCVLLMLWPLSAFAQNDPDSGFTARRAAQMLDKAAISLGKSKDASDQISALTSVVKAYEEGLLALREGLRLVSLREQSLNAELLKKQDRTARLLGVLQSIGQSPASVLLLHPSGAESTVRSAMLVSSITPALQAEAEALKNQLTEARMLAGLQTDAISNLESGLTGAQLARTSLSQAVADRRVLPRAYSDDPVAMAILLESSTTLQGFAAGLSEIDKIRESTGLPNFELAQGQMPLPVTGRVLHGFNDKDAAGVKRPGWVVSAQSNALVQAPWPATIRYLGPLLDYGNVIVLEPAPAFLMVIAGMNQVYGEVGEFVAQGAPIGLMPSSGETDDEFLQAAVSGSSVTPTQTLYIELRQGDEAVDPAKWFKRTKE